MDIANVIISIIGIIVLPAVGALFKWMFSLSSKISALELQVARDYVSVASLREIMAPIQKDVRDLEWLMRRIADKLHVPAVSEE